MKYVIQKTCFIALLLNLFCASQLIPGESQQGCFADDPNNERFAAFAQQVGFLNASILSDYDPSNKDVATVGLALHIITDDNGNQGITNQDLSAGVNYLNTAFTEIKINFVVVHQDTIQNDDYVSTTSEDEEYLADIYNKPYAINIYIIPNPSAKRSTFSSQLQQWYNTYFPDCSAFSEYIILGSTSFNSTSLPHEMGHFFDLFHTYEYVALGDGNTFQTGDLLTDTPIDAFRPNDCNSTDPDELLLSKNFMAYPSGCRSEFTTQQKQKIRHTLETTTRSSLIRTDIVLKNEINSANAGNSLSASQNGIIQIVESGNKAYLVENLSSTIKTNTERFQNGNTIYKHKLWNSNVDEIKLEKIFNVQAGLDQTAKFIEVESVVINNYSISTNQTNTNDLYIKFTDPWYVDANGNQTGEAYTINTFPHIPTGNASETSGGVFLNQDYNIPGNPYYTVRADDQTINGIDYFLESWSGSNVTFEDAAAEETAVVFAAVSATVTANLKGHQASNTTAATSGNNSRKVVWAEPGAVDYYFQTYIDNGHVYYSYSTDAGAS